MTAVLFIDDDATGRETAAYTLRKAGYEVDLAADGAEGVGRFNPDRHALVLSDVRMPKMDGMQVLDSIKKRSPGTPVIMITAFPDVSLAVDAMKAGAADFISKPFSRDHLLLVAQRTLDRKRIEEENRTLRSQARGIERPIVFASEAMAKVVSMADRLAHSDSTVLLSGESGTGKELLARRIHARSTRSEGPFVALNCAAMPENLVEAELFGHEKGAFTGADKARPGRFRQAHQGTLFLDEISELPLPAQAKLLRVLQEGTVDVLGRDHPENVDVRIVAATNRDLKAEVASGRFRSDLYYRVNVVEIAIPPLRDRPGDVGALVRHLLAQAPLASDVEPEPDLLAELARRRWPGNVRELANALERLVVLSPPGTLDPTLLPPEAPAGTAEPNLPPGRNSTIDHQPSTIDHQPSTVDHRPSTIDHQPSTVDHRPSTIVLPEEGVSLFDLERDVIAMALGKHGWNVSRTAAFLRVPRHILTYRIAKYGIRRP